MASKNKSLAGKFVLHIIFRAAYARKLVRAMYAVDIDNDINDILMFYSMMLSFKYEAHYCFQFFISRSSILSVL